LFRNSRRLRLKCGSVFVAPGTNPHSHLSGQIPNPKANLQSSQKLRLVTFQVSTMLPSLYKNQKVPAAYVARKPNQFFQKLWFCRVIVRYNHLLILAHQMIGGYAQVSQKNAA